MSCEQNMSAAFLDVSTELLREGFCINFQTPGQSMYPTIRDGEKVLVEPVLTDALKRGDVLLYRRGERLIAHRLLRIERTAEISLILRGDALGQADAPIHPNQVLGRVVSVERQGLEHRLKARPDSLKAGARRLILRLRKGLAGIR